MGIYHGSDMPINTTITDGIVYTDISGELNLELVLQHIDLIVSMGSKLTNHYELHDFTNVEGIRLSSDDMARIASYAVEKTYPFQHSYIAIYANNEFTFGMARMFEIFFELANHPTIIQIFKDKKDAIQFLKDEMDRNA